MTCSLIISDLSWTIFFIRFFGDYGLLPVQCARVIRLFLAVLLVPFWQHWSIWKQTGRFIRSSYPKHPHNLSTFQFHAPEHFPRCQNYCNIVAFLTAEENYTFEQTVL